MDIFAPTQDVRDWSGAPFWWGCSSRNRPGLWSDLSGVVSLSRQSRCLPRRTEPQPIWLTVAFLREPFHRDKRNRNKWTYFNVNCFVVCWPFLRSYHQKVQWTLPLRLLPSCSAGRDDVCSISRNHLVFDELSDNDGNLTQARSEHAQIFKLF